MERMETQTTQNLVMKTEDNNKLGVRRFGRETEKNNNEEETVEDGDSDHYWDAEDVDDDEEEEMNNETMEDGDSDHYWDVEDEVDDDEEEKMDTVEEISDGLIGGYNKEKPPVDDVCPICFDRFIIPCRSNCGHWFCANCILQFWMFRSSVQPCKCPLCCCRVVNLKLEASQLTKPAADDDQNMVAVLKKVDQYNGLYINGVVGAFHVMLAMPLFMGRILRILIDPDGLRCIYYVMRLLGLCLALIYEKGEFEFIPTGGFGIQRAFDVGASMLILCLFLVGIGYRWVLRGRVRRLAALQASDS